MTEINVEAGACFGYGGTNARMAVCVGGDIQGFDSLPTPSEPDSFFDQMASQMLNASYAGAHWLVAGFPGPVSPDGQVVGPLNNVKGMREEEYDLRERLTVADPEVGRLLEQGFVLLAVNDGTLAAQAAASRIGRNAYKKTGALIFGTGVGSGVVQKDPAYANVHRTDNSNPYEIGHLAIGGNPLDTYEKRYSGPGIEKRYHASPEKLPAGHAAWVEQGEAVGTLATTLSLMCKVELVVPTGGVGAGASDKYMSSLYKFIESYRTRGSAPQKKFDPDVMLVPPAEADEFEMYGAEGVMRDHLTAQAAR